MGVNRIAYFDSVPMSDALNAMNTIIQGLNRNWATYGGVNGTNFCTLAALRYWLANNNSPAFIYEVDNALQADIARPAAILWQGDGWVDSGDPLMTFIAGLGIVVPPLGTLPDPAIPVPPAGGGVPSDYIPIIFV